MCKFFICGFVDDCIYVLCMFESENDIIWECYLWMYEYLNDCMCECKYMNAWMCECQ